MSIPWQSLKIRYAIIASLFIAVILLVNAMLLVYLKYKEFQNDIEQRAFSFANLAVKPICDGYDTYYYSGYFKFRELMTKLISNEPDITRVRLLDVSGRILFDSENLKKSHFIPQADATVPLTSDPYYLDSIRKLDLSFRHLNNAGGEKHLEIVSPYVEEWGRHKHSVVMTFSYVAIRPQIRTMIYQIGALSLLSMLFTSLIAWIVAERITHPLDVLTERAKGVIKNTTQKTEIQESENEIKLLTNTFNVMTSRLQENIQQLEENNVKLAALNEELKALDRLKSDLLANVSHELRTPLTSIKGYTEYILEGKLGPITQKQERGLAVMQRNLERLSKLISALLDYSLMDADRMVLNIKPFSAQILARQIQANLASELEKRGIQFEIDLPDNVPPIAGDRDKIYQVLENLTINAIKFTDNGGQIRITAAEEQVDAKQFVEIKVTDTGIGIPQSAVHRIFDRFYQVDATSKRKYGGMGLGLAIARSIVDAHKGSISVNSEEGQGTTFRVLLPAAGVQPSGAYNLRSKKENGENYFIEIIDDDSKLLRIIRMSLEDEGFRVITAETAKEGFKIAKEMSPDVILLDVLLPDQDGFQLLQTLKSDPHTSAIPVVILSVIKEKLKGLNLGAADYLVKPVGHSLLKASLERILTNEGSTKTILIVDDEKDTLEFLKQRLNEEGFHTIEANNGREAVEKATHNHPDLILLDIMMPEINGWDVMEQLRKEEKTAAIPVVVLSAASNEKDVERGYKMGIKHYMTKPFQILDLVTQIRNAVKNKNE